MPLDKAIALLMSTEMHAELEAIADHLEENVSIVIRRYIREGLSRDTSSR